MLTGPERADLVNQLEDSRWPAVAEDIASGDDPATVIARLRAIGEADSDAVAILSNFTHV